MKTKCPLAMAGTFFLAVTACVAPETHENAGPETGVRNAYTMSAAPRDAAPGTCWAEDVSPAILETISERVQVAPAQAARRGRPARPAVWRTETRETVLKPREVLNFRTPCGIDLSPEYITSLQRALAARDAFDGAVSGILDSATEAAIRRFQRSNGLDSAFLSMETAQMLGLSEVPRDAASQAVE